MTDGLERMYADERMTGGKIIRESLLECLTRLMLHYEHTWIVQKIEEVARARRMRE